ncbi:MAG: hypothetical protein M1825_004243 [Sarcosagium campestre]|nr:MAG: hypothetical protein M1825_004243 [Sarcosagium campestre]
MGKAFFNGWELWEKMCFILACAIVVTVQAGILKLVWNHWRIRKYTALAEAKKTHLQEMRRSRHVIQLRGEEVPFGVRAIESGIEVDGVWISRSNSPAPTRPDSPAQDINNDTTPRNFLPTLSGGLTPFAVDLPQSRGSAAASVSRLSIPQAVHNPPSLLSRPSSDASVYSRNPGDRLSGLGPLTSNPFDHDDIAYGPITRSVSDESIQASISNPRSQESPRNSSHEQDAGLRTFFLEEDDESIKEGSVSGESFSNNQFGSYRTSYYASASDDSECERSSVSLEEPAGALALFQPQPQRPPQAYQPTTIKSPEALQQRAADSKRMSDLEDLFSRRLSHAAEVGQLTPRTRRAVVAKSYNGAGSMPGDKKALPSDGYFAAPQIAHVTQKLGITLQPAPRARKIKPAPVAVPLVAKAGTFPTTNSSGKGGKDAKIAPLIDQAGTFPKPPKGPPSLQRTGTVRNARTAAEKEDKILQPAPVREKTKPFARLLPKLDKSAHQAKDSKVEASLGTLSVEIPEIRVVHHTPTGSTDTTVSEEQFKISVQRHTISSIPSEEGYKPQLHQNKTIRKVNPGFEVLPAGFFQSSWEKEIGMPEDDWGRDLEAGDNKVHKPRKLRKTKRQSSTIG